MPQELTEERVEGQGREIWKPVAGYEGCYSVSMSGKIKREKSAMRAIVGKESKTYKNEKGYLEVVLCENNKHKTWRVHKLVAITFLGNPPKGLQVNHIDGVKTNNHVSNLEYVTASENVRHGYRLGLYKPHCGGRGEKCNTAKLKEKDILEIRELSYKNIYTQNELSKIYKITRQMIGCIINRKNWTHI